MVLTGATVALYTVSGDTSTYSNETMNEVNETARGQPRYTVYEISNSAKRYMSTSEVPVFQKQIGGEGDWITITSDEISDIQYPGGRLILKDSLSEYDLVRCSSGEYYNVITELGGATTLKITDKYNLSDCTCFGDSAVARHPVTKEWSASIDKLLITNEDVTTLDDVLMIAVMYLHEDDDMRYEGYCYLEGCDVSITPNELIKGSMTLSGHGPLYFRMS